MKALIVGDLRRAIEGVPDETEIVVRATQEDEDSVADIDFCSALVSAQVERAHDEKGTPFLALDAYAGPELETEDDDG